MRFFDGLNGHQKFWICVWPCFGLAVAIALTPIFFWMASRSYIAGELTKEAMKAGYEQHLDVGQDSRHMDDQVLWVKKD